MEKILVFVNGRSRLVTADTTITDIIRSLELHPDNVMVERNGSTVDPGEYSKTQLQKDDKLSFIRLATGT